MKYEQKPTYDIRKRHKQTGYTVNLGLHLEEEQACRFIDQRENEENYDYELVPNPIDTAEQ